MSVAQEIGLELKISFEAVRHPGFPPPSPLGVVLTSPMVGLSVACKQIPHRTFLPLQSFASSFRKLKTTPLLRFFHIFSLPLRVGFSLASWPPSRYGTQEFSLSLAACSLQPVGPRA